MSPDASSYDSEFYYGPTYIPWDEYNDDNDDEGVDLNAQLMEDDHYQRQHQHQDNEPIHIILIIEHVQIQVSTCIILI